MAEIKNNFLASKMNQDVDDRLLPNNEYRYALNLEVNRSENSDVGTLQNVYGNSLSVDFNTLTGSTGLECIGAYSDNSGNDIYVFLTNNNNSTYNKDASNFIYVYNSLNNTSTRLVTGAFLNFSTLNPVLGINLLENMLFWTDNRNQPRRINVQSAASSLTYYQYEEQISVAKLSPLYAMELFKLSTLTGVPADTYETTMYDVVSVNLPNNSTANPYYDSTYAGDPAYLEDKFIRFSYRYKFEDGEYSIMAPFTQITYIPKQDGYFMYDPPVSPSTEPARDDETNAYRSTIVSFMKNKVNNILLQIELPCAANLLKSLYKISYIEILYKDANELTVNAVDSIPVDPSNGGVFNTSATVYSYNYQSKKPFKTLPERDLIRVYDKTPVKALAQEVVANRVVYSNYQDKFSFPKYLDYNVGVSTKLPFGFTENKGTSIIEYPNHSVKQNRNYQVGVVLCDKFGRESGVILSNKTTSTSNGPSLYGASSLYEPYLSYGEITPSQWPGNSLKILFNSLIQPPTPDTVTGWPGLYNGDTTSSSYNPLGWYSYKIVVKQTEQEYYNVYIPGNMASYPTTNTLELGKTSHTVLLNDNINKVPRDLNEVGPAQLQFRSSVVLYPRVDNNTQPYHNQMYFPGISSSIVSTIATNDSLFWSVSGVPTTTPPAFNNFYQLSSNPLIARISTPSILGVQASSSSVNVINLAVYETKPVESKLDIYWETSSVGLISELNLAIQNGAGVSINELIGWSFSLTEAQGNGSLVTTTPPSIPSTFHFTNIAGIAIIPDSVIIVSAVDQYGTSVLSKFVLEPFGSPGNYRLKTAAGAYFYYGFDSINLNSYTFNIRATIGTISNTFVRNGLLTNITPSITTVPSGGVVNASTGQLNVFQFVGNNGSNPSGGNSTSDLTWSVTGSSEFTIDSTGQLKTSNSTIQGTYNLVVKLTEASGDFVTTNVTVNYPVIASVTFSSYFNGSGGSGTIGQSGTVTIVGTSATFWARAIVYSTGPVSTTITINSINRNVTSTIGVNDSTSFVLTPGVYSYSFSTTINGGGGGGIYFTQP
jgi:hypothetical protein